MGKPNAMDYYIKKLTKDGMYRFMMTALDEMDHSLTERDAGFVESNPDRPFVHPPAPK